MTALHHRNKSRTAVYPRQLTVFKVTIPNHPSLSASPKNSTKSVRYRALLHNTCPSRGCANTLRHQESGQQRMFGHDLPATCQADHALAHLRSPQIHHPCAGVHHISLQPRIGRHRKQTRPPRVRHHDCIGRSQPAQFLRTGQFFHLLPALPLIGFRCGAATGAPVRGCLPVRNQHESLPYFTALCSQRPDATEDRQDHCPTKEPFFHN